MADEERSENAKCVLPIQVFYLPLQTGKILDKKSGIKILFSFRFFIFMVCNSSILVRCTQMISVSADIIF